MDEWKQNVVFALVGMIILALGCWIIIDNGEVSAKAAILLALGLFCSVGSSWLVVLDVREILSTRREKAKLGTPARLELDMPYHELVARFLALAKVDDMVTVEQGWLSWKTQSFADISIRRVGESDWMALYWVRSNWHYTDTQLRRVCKSAAQEMPEEFKKAEAHGLLIYSKGVLSIYPEPHRKQVEDAFMDNIFLPTREAFMTWLVETEGEEE